jgi:hemoglobin-like flavoprotein
VFGLDLGSGLAGIQAAPDIALPGKKNLDPRVLTIGLSSSRPQRMSVYVQRKLDGFPEAGKIGVFNTSASEKWQCAHQNTILIYENSHDDCEEIIQGPALLGLEWKAAATRDEDVETALIRTMEHILLHVFTKVLRAWRKQLALLSIQHAQLEDRVYGQPSDDSHATELWAMSKYLWGMAKLVNRHSNLIEDVQENFNQFAERRGDVEWLDDVARDFRQASVTIQEDFIRPTEHMIDLVRLLVTSEGAEMKC